MLSRNHVLQNRYRILRPLGKGGMGHVYEAMDDAVDCIVAIKETFAATDKLRRAFEREAKLLANLRHPVLPRVTHHFLEGEGQFLVMDYIEGLNLQELLALRKHPFRAEELLSEADKLLGALHYLHSRSEPIIHRDIKPANIKRTSEGEIFLLDFGLAKGSAGQMATVEPGESFYSSVYGYTAAYAPLEQLTNAGTNAQSDLYGLGATLYHLFTGHAPLSANVRYEALEMGAVDPLPTIHQVNPQIPELISDVISQAMQMSRRDRTRTASEMREALREASRAAQESLDAQLPSTLVPQVETSAPAEERIPKEQTKSDQNVPQATAMSPTIGSPAGVVPAGRARQDQSTINVPPPVVSSPHPDSKPSVEVSWPSHINTSDSPAAPAEERSEERTPAAVGAVQSNFAESETARRRAEAPVSTMVAGRHSAPDLIWQQPSSLSARILGPAPGKRKGSTAIIVVICAIVALVGIGAVAIVYISSTQTTSTNTANTYNAAPASNTKKTSSPVSYAFRRDLQGNQGVVWAVAFSPDGKLVATAGDDHSVRFYDSGSFNVSDEWKQSSVINSISFSPVGNFIASASNDRTISLMKMKGAPVTLTGHRDEVYFVAFSPDGKTLASASKDKTVRIWDVQSGREIKMLTGHSDVVWSVAFSPDGMMLASASKDKTVKIWDTRTWEPIRTLTGHKSAVISLAFSPHRGALATGSDDNTIKLWDSFLLTEIRTLTGHTSYITSLAFSADGETLASAGNDMTVRLWNPQTGEARQTLTGHTKGVTSVSFSPDGKTIITGSRDQTVKVWQ